MPRLILQLRETPLGHGHWVYEWWFLDGSLVAQQGVADTFDSMAATYQQLLKGLSSLSVVVFPPAHRLHLRRLTLTTSQRRHIDTVLPYLIEPFVAQGIESLTVSWAPAKGHQVWCVAVETAMLEDWRADLRRMGLDQAILLPSQYVITQSLDDSIRGAIILGDHFDLEQDQICWRPSALIDSATISANTPVYGVEALQDCLHRSKHWAAWQMMATKRQNSARNNAVLRWSLAVVLLLLALSLQVIDRHYATAALHAQAQSIERASEQLFLSLVPDAGRVVNLSRQLDARLQQASQQQLAPSEWAAYEFLAHLSEIPKVLKIESGLQQIWLRQNDYRFEWVAPTRQELERIQHFLSQQNRGVELIQWTRQDEQYLGVFRARGAAN